VYLLFQLLLIEGLFSVKAFLSHSSKDKHFVGQVAAALGTLQIEYDDQTFEPILNVQAIRRALNRSDLFVVFLSANSIASSYVAEEERTALEARGRGVLKRILIFAIDNTSYRALPAWLRETNVVNQLSSPKTCARRIQATLIELAAEEYRNFRIYLGREDDEKQIRRALSAPLKETPLAIHAVGHLGIGRRTFLRNALSSTYPRQFQVFVEISFGQYQGVEELFRALYNLHVVSSLADTIIAFDEFSTKSYPSQIAEIARIVSELTTNGESLVVVDDGGVYDEQGDYQSFFKDLVIALNDFDRPVISFAQTRMMPFARRQNYGRSFHIYLKPLTDDSVQELLSFGLKDRGINFTSDQIRTIAEHLDGHPFNVRFAIKYIEAYGIDSLLHDPSELIEWKRRRAEDFLNRLDFNKEQVEVLALLAEYRYVATDMLISVVSSDPAETAQNLRDLEEFCCIERRESYFHISAPIREAVRRDPRFQKPDSWKQAIGNTICDLIQDYKEDDSVRVPILESATLAAAKGASAPAFLSHLILPSHLLRIARDFYDKGRRADCIEFCRRAYNMKGRLPMEAQVEVLRLWGSSAIRLNDAAAYNSVQSELAAYTSPVARRVSYFLEGFHYRLRGDLDSAERMHRQAWAISPDNQAVNRELASVYCKQHRYSEAETHARAAYKIAPTNPFLIDILAETLLGKMQMGLKIDQQELNEILHELSIYGDAPGSSFFLIRDAQRKARSRDYVGALKLLDRAIDRTPTLLSPYFIRADVHLRANDVPGAQRDLNKINQLLADAGGFSEGDEALAQDLEVRIMIEGKQFRSARDRIKRAAFLPAHVSARLTQQLAKAIAFAPQNADQELREWARKH
jgi:tetratricopeptide (TPR) repeat protein